MEFSKYKKNNMPGPSTVIEGIMNWCNIQESINISYHTLQLKEENLHEQMHSVKYNILSGFKKKKKKPQQIRNEREFAQPD